MNRNVMIAIGSLAAIGAGATMYINVKQGRKDELAHALIREVKKVLQPSSAGLMAENAFGIHYAEETLGRVQGKILMLKEAVTNGMAQEIHNSFGGWWQGGDDEDRLYGIFRKLKDKVQVSQVAKAYYNKYRVNLIDKLYDKLTDKEVGIILDIVGQLPNYRRSV